MPDAASGEAAPTLRRWPAEIPAELDLDRVAEEIEDLGSAELQRRQEPDPADPGSSDQGSVRAERRRRCGIGGLKPRTFHADLLDRYAPSMRQQIDMQELWQARSKIAERCPRRARRHACSGVPERCPFACRTSSPKSSASMRARSGCAAGERQPDHATRLGQSARDVRRMPHCRA